MFTNLNLSKIDFMKFKIFTFLVLLSTFSWAQAPKITSFSPTSAEVGDTVSITGSNFDTTAANNIVYFGATKTNVLTASFGTLTVTVPVGASTAPISVTNQCDLTAYSGTH